MDRPAGPWNMAPWLNWWAQGKTDQPLSGDVSQFFKVLSPNVTVNGVGDPGLEREIVEDVATYGAQIGQLTELVLAMAEGRDPAQTEALAKLRDIAAAVEKKKAEYGRTALERARKALDDLREHDRNGFDLLVASLGARKRD